MNRLAAISFLISVAFTAVAPALAQNSGKIWRLGVLTLPTSTSSPVFETFRSVVFPELAKQGYVEGGNLVVEIRVGAPDKLPELARELAATRPDVVIAVSSWAIDAVRQASPTTPIVGSFIGIDPIAAGYATSLARPGSNITGIVMLAPELDAKRVDVLHQAIPWARRIAALARSKRLEAASLAEMEKAATQIGLELLIFYAATPEEFPAAFAKMRETGVQALAIASVPEFAGNAAALAAQALASPADSLRVGLDGAGGVSPRLWPGLCRAAPPHRGLRGSHLSWCGARGTADGAADAFQVYGQSEDGDGARSHLVPEPGGHGSGHGRVLRALTSGLRGGLWRACVSSASAPCARTTSRAAQPVQQGD